MFTGSATRSIKGGHGFEAQPHDREYRSGIPFRAVDVGSDGTRKMLDFSPLAGVGASPLVVLFVILVLDLVLGLVPGGGRLHLPIIGVEGLFSNLERFLDLEKRKRASRILLGVLVCLTAIFGVAVLGWLAWWGAGKIPFGILVEIAVLSIAVSQRRAISALLGAAEGLRSNDLTFARFALSPVLPSSLSRADSSSVARIAIEEGALGFLQRLMVPVFWYILAGLPGVFVYGVLLAMVPVVKPLDPAPRDFGLAAAGFQAAFHYLPTRIAALILLAASAVLPGTDRSKAVATLFSHRKHYPDINGGWLLAPVAGALDLSLCGPEVAAETGRPTIDWIGEGRAEADHRDVRRAARLLTVAASILAASVAVLMMVKLF